MKELTINGAVVQAYTAESCALRVAEPCALYATVPRASHVGATGREVVGTGHLHGLVVRRDIRDGIVRSTRRDGHDDVPGIERFRRDVGEERLTGILKPAFRREHGRRDQTRVGVGFSA